MEGKPGLRMKMNLYKKAVCCFCLIILSIVLITLNCKKKNKDLIPQDTTPPETAITSFPPALNNFPSVIFEFTCNEDNCTFECQIDSEPFETCSSPKTYTGLSDGEHTFNVQATDSTGNTDTSPATDTWTTDRTPPETSITSQPANPSKVITATFEWTSDDSNATFECRLNGGTWTSCSSPKTYPNLTYADYTFDVRAKDLAGNVDSTPANYAWSVIVYCSINSNCGSGKICLDGYCVIEPTEDVKYSIDDNGNGWWESGETSNPSDYICLNNNPDPVQGADILIAGKANDFATGDNAPIGNAKVLIYSTNDVSQPPACSLTSDITGCDLCPGSNPSTCGDVTGCVLPENSRFTYKIDVSDGQAKPGGDVDFGAQCNDVYTGKNTYRFNILNSKNNDNGTPADPSDDFHSEEFLVISNGMFSILPALAQVTQDATKGIIGGEIVNCALNPVHHAVLTMINADGKAIKDFNTSSTDAVRYYRYTPPFGRVPSYDGADTDFDGLFSIFNVTSGDYIIKAYGKINGIITLLGAAKSKVLANSLSITDIEPCKDINCTPIGQ